MTSVIPFLCKTQLNLRSTLQGLRENNDDSALQINHSAYVSSTMINEVLI